jgi:hypothetical protein
MYGPPTCSQDVAELREAVSDTEEARRRREAVDALMHARYCVGGWVGEDQHGRPAPCPVCHPGIEARLARSRGLGQACTRTGAGAR